MKKLVIGCLAVLVVLGMCAAVSTWYVSRYVYRQVRTTYEQFAQFKEVPSLEAEVRNRAAYAPPESGELSAGQVERLGQVQGAVRTTLGSRFEELRDKYRALFEKADPTVIDVPQVMAAYRDLASIWMEAKRAQVDALNKADLSLDEYRWVRRRAYAALGLPVMEVDVARIVEAVTSGKAVEDPSVLGGAIAPTGPDSNKALVEPMRKQLEENIALAVFGL